MRLTAWDRRLAARALGLAGVAALVALVVIITTDDRATWARRAAMWGAVASVAGAVGTLGALRLAESRGELLALSAIGASPVRARIGAVIGGVALAIAGSCVAGSRWADRSALFPRPVEARVWLMENGTDEPAGEGGELAQARSVRGSSLREVTMGIRVERGGRVAFLGESAPEKKKAASETALGGLPRNEGEAGASAALALCAIACPVWVAVRGSLIRKAGVGLVATFAVLVAFQAVAMNRGSPLLLGAAPLLLLADAFAARYRAR